jgi:hypothetical protein
MKAQHTPGPWKVGDRQPDNHAVNVLDPRGFLTAQARAAGAGWDGAKANARLIAAATDMLAALEGVMRYCVTPSGMPDVGKGRTEEQQAALNAARAAIAKANGA